MVFTQEELEEIKCLRAVLERILRVMDEGLFVDYQMEKYGYLVKLERKENIGWCEKLKRPISPLSSGECSRDPESDDFVKPDGVYYCFECAFYELREIDKK